MHFKSTTEYLTVKDKLPSLSPKERIEYTNKIGFDSRLKIIQDAYTQLESAQTMDGYNSTLKKYSDVLKVTNNIVESINLTENSCLLNREGLIYIGRALYRFTEKEEFITINSTLSEARKSLFNSSLVGKSVKKIELSKKSLQSGRVMDRSCSSLSGEVSTSNRRARVSSEIQFIAYLTDGDPSTFDDYYEVQDRSFTEGVAYKKIIFGSWVRYNTDNWLFTSYVLDYSSYFTNEQNVTYNVSNYKTNTQCQSIDHSLILGIAYDVYSADVSAHYQHWSNTYTESCFRDPNSCGYYSTSAISNVMLACP